MDQTLKTLRVSVLMPVHNGERYIAAAIESILAQTFVDFEFLIVNDGSTDGTEDIARSYTDPRIRIIQNEKERGFVGALNLGLDEAQGEYIARMDSDDICLPTRFMTQVAFMDANPTIGICGSWIRILGTRNVAKYFTEPEDVHASLLFTTSLAHPAVMMRRSTVCEFGLRYDNLYPYSEDYGFWYAASLHTKLANVPRVLLEYRIHAESMSRTKTEAQRDAADRIRLVQLHALGLDPTPEQLRLHNMPRLIAGESTASFLQAAQEWLLLIRDANEQKRIYERASLGRVLYERWRAICSSYPAAMLFTSSPLFRFGGSKRYFDALKMVIRSLFVTAPRPSA